MDDNGLLINIYPSSIFLQIGISALSVDASDRIEVLRRKFIPGVIGEILLILSATAISCRSHWIPSDLQSYAAKSPSNTVVGDHTGRPGCCSFYSTLKCIKQFRGNSICYILL